MYNMKNVQKEVESLRNDTSRVLEDVARVHRSITDLGREELSTQAEHISRRVESNVEALVEKGHDLRAGAERLLTTSVRQVRANPYPFVAALAALGLAAGVLVPLFLRRQDT